MGEGTHTYITFDLPLEGLARKLYVSRPIDFAKGLAHDLRDTADVCFRASGDGLRIFAADEDTFADAAQLVRGLYGDLVEVCMPTVRSIPGPPRRHPVMAVRVSTRRDYMARVREELRCRDAEILEECSGSRLYIVRGLAPMSKLFGLPATLAALTNRSAVHWIRLSHYAPMPPFPDESCGAVQKREEPPWMQGRCRSSP